MAETMMGFQMRASTRQAERPEPGVQELLACIASIYRADYRRDRDIAMMQVAREFSADKLELLASDGALDLDDAMSSAAVALERASHAASISVKESLDFRKQIKAASELIDESQKASRALIEQMAHG